MSYTGFSVKKLLAAIVLVGSLFEPGTLASVALGARDACHDHACLCATKCPPKKTAGDCHGRVPEAGIRGTCRHDAEGFLAPAIAGELPEAPEVARLTGLEEVASSVPRRTQPGTTRLDLPPPRPC
jgi:hypothetical protein